MKRSFKSTVGVLAVLLASTALQADFRLVENFDGMAAGSPDGVACTGVMGGTWDTEAANTGNVTVEDNSGSRVVRFMTTTAGAGRGVGFNGITNTINPGEKGKVFFRFMLRSDTQVPRAYIGLITDTSDNPITSTNTNTPTNIPVGFGLVDNGSGGFNLVTTDGMTVLKPDLVRTQWYNVWIEADYGRGTFDLYLSPAPGPGGEPTLPDPEDCVGTRIPFLWAAMGAPLTGMIFACPTAKNQSTRTYIDEIWWDGDQGLPRSSKATSPSPADKGQDVPRDGVLGWTPGPYAAAHDVYFGTSLADVDGASRTTSNGVLVSQGQTTTTFDPPGLLAFGQTYYWRVDEVNAAPDFTTFKGRVWSFTAEPYAYAITPVNATASSVHDGMTGPEKTMDNSGLNAMDQHSTTPEHMWLSSAKGPTPAWIQYEFESVTKLHEMWVWNSNGKTETIDGWGAKEVTVEVSLDGTTWTAVSNVPEFARATGEPNYVHNTTVDFGGILAQYVRLTIQSNWGGQVQCGLSEVRFFEVPVRAFKPSPETGTTDVELDAVLRWRPGREAVLHQVCLGTDSNAVAAGSAQVSTVTEAQVALSSFSPEYGRTYYWKVNEVNEAAMQPSWAGDVWSLSVVPYGIVEDFESYENAERIIVHGGRQSMLFRYNNTQPPYYSETWLWLDGLQSWIGNGADTLTLYVRGNLPSFVEYVPGTIVMNGMGTDIYGTTDEGRFVCKQLSGDGTIVARVDSLYNTDPWAKAGVMIRETLEAGSSWAYAVATPRNGTHFLARLAAGSAATGDTTLTLPTTQRTAQLPIWVKLERTGNQFSAYYAIGETVTEWTANPWNPQTIVMAKDVTIGLAVTSHVANRVCRATLSGVSTTGNVSGSWQAIDLGTAQTTGGNSPEPLYVVVCDNAGNSGMVTHPNPAVIATGEWEEWNVPLSELAAAGANLDRVMYIAIGVGDRDSQTAGGRGELYIDDLRLIRTGP